MADFLCTSSFPVNYPQVLQPLLRTQANISSKDFHLLIPQIVNMHLLPALHTQ